MYMMIYHVQILFMGGLLKSQYRGGETKIKVENEGTCSGDGRWDWEKAHLERDWCTCFLNVNIVITVRSIGLFCEGKCLFPIMPKWLE